MFIWLIFHGTQIDIWCRYCARTHQLRLLTGIFSGVVSMAEQPQAFWCLVHCWLLSISCAGYVTSFRHCVRLGTIIGRAYRNYEICCSYTTAISSIFTLHLVRCSGHSRPFDLSKLDGAKFVLSWNLEQRGQNCLCWSGGCCLLKEQPLLLPNIHGTHTCSC